MPDIAKFVYDYIAYELGVEEHLIKPEANLSLTLVLDDVDVMELIVVAEEELSIIVGDVDESILLDQYKATVQTAIDLFTKLYQQFHK